MEDIEKKYPAQAEKIVHQLEEYCEIIYEINEGMIDDISSLKKCLEAVKSEYQRITGKERAGKERGKT